MSAGEKRVLKDGCSRTGDHGRAIVVPRRETAAKKRPRIAPRPSTASNACTAVLLCCRYCRYCWFDCLVARQDPGNDQDPRAPGVEAKKSNVSGNVPSSSRRTNLRWDYARPVDLIATPGNAGATPAALTEARTGENCSNRLDIGSPPFQKYGTCRGRTVAEAIAVIKPSKGVRHYACRLSAPSGYQRSTLGPTSAPNAAGRSMPSVYQTSRKGGAISGQYRR